MCVWIRRVAIYIQTKNDLSRRFGAPMHRVPSHRSSELATFQRIAPEPLFSTCLFVFSFFSWLIHPPIDRPTGNATQGLAVALSVACNCRVLKVYARKSYKQPKQQVNFT